MLAIGRKSAFMEALLESTKSFKFAHYDSDIYLEI